MAASTVSKDSNGMAAVAYVLTILTGVLMYVMKPDDKYVKFHAVQSILLGVSYAIIWMVVGALMTGLSYALPFGGFLLGFGLFGILWLVFLLVWLYCIYKAYSGERFKLPIIGNMAENFAK